jgi:hypothetical protein
MTGHGFPEIIEVYPGFDQLHMENVLLAAIMALKLNDLVGI